MNFFDIEKKKWLKLPYFDLMAKYARQKQTTEKSETKHRQKKYFKASQIALLNGEISNKVKTVQRCLKSKL